MINTGHPYRLFVDAKQSFHAVIQFVQREAFTADVAWASTGRMSSRETIYALSSGQPPAAIAVIRISGPRAGAALEALMGRLPEPRKGSFARVRDPSSGEIIDEALALWFPAPASETGEDVAELQIHGGRAVIAATLEAFPASMGCGWRKRANLPGAHSRTASWI